jgi:hypothetical protein
VWSPNIAVEGGRLFWRVRVLQTLVFFGAVALAALAFVAAIILHQPALVRASFIAMAVYSVSRAAYLGLRLRYVLSLGRWTGLRREPIRRLEEPLHYWIRTSAEVLALVITIGAAIFFACMAGLGPAG